MDQTSNLKLPYIIAAQAQKHVTHNDALAMLDTLVQLAVEDKDLAAPPTSPQEGQSYIPAAGASGDWAGHAGHIAAFQAGAWAFYVPREGWLVWVRDEDQIYAFSGADWSAIVPELNPTPLLGLNTTADATNRLSVASAASLFTHAGAGHQLKINKAASADTGSILFQTGYSGRAEFGLTGDDDFHVKVSADGNSWVEAIVVDRASGAVSLPNTGQIAGETAVSGSYTLALSDRGKRVRATAAAAVVLPSDALVPFPTNARVELVRFGEGEVTISGAPGVVIRSRPGHRSLAHQYGRALLDKIAPNEWLLSGDLKSSAPAWVPAGAGAVLNLRTGQYFFSELEQTQAQAFAGLVAASTTARTYRGADGLFKSDLAANSPRFDYRHGARQLALNDTATNVLLRSAELESALWSKSNTQAVANQTTAPDGTVGADRVSDSGGGSQYVSQSFAVTAGVTYVVSVFAKAQTSSLLQLTYFSGAFSGLGFANFDLAAGSVTATGGAHIASGIEDWGNGWWRCWLAATATATGSTSAVVGMISSGGDGRLMSQVVSGKSINLWGCEVGVGSLPSAHIPTASAAITRAIESFELPGAIETLLQAGEGTVLVQGREVRRPGGCILGGAGANGIVRQSATSIRATNASALDAAAGSGSLDGAFGLALAWSAAGRALCLNGGTVASDTHRQGDFSIAYLGRDGANTAYGDGWYDRVVVYPTRLSDADLQAVAMPYA